MTLLLLCWTIVIATTLVGVGVVALLARLEKACCDLTTVASITLAFVGLVCVYVVLLVAAVQGNANVNIGVGM